MYIPEFWCGFIVGVIVTIVVITVWAIWYDRRNK